MENDTDNPPTQEESSEQEASGDGSCTQKYSCDNSERNSIIQTLLLCCDETRKLNHGTKSMVFGEFVNIILERRKYLRLVVTVVRGDRHTDIG